MAQTNDHRIRGRRLQRIRHDHFAKHPLCVVCKGQGIVRLAVELDHVTPLHKGGKDFDADRGLNRQGLCAPCHKAKSAAEQGHQYSPKQRFGADGYPIEE
jgi:5-methylcytosine-specific restriction protein A